MRHIFVQRDNFPPPLIAVPVGHQVVSDPVQPSLKRHALLNIIADMRKRAKEDLGRQVFRVMHIARSIVHIAVYFWQISLVEFAKSRLVLLRQRDQLPVIEFRIIDSSREWILHSVFFLTHSARAGYARPAGQKEL